MVLRIFLLGHPVGGELKTEPDSETLGAKWVTLDECSEYRLRSNEVLRHFRYVAEGGAVFPMSMLTLEGAPYP